MERKRAILDILIDNPEGLRYTKLYNEICEKLGIILGKQTFDNLLKQLREDGLVDRIEVSKKNVVYAIKQNPYSEFAEDCDRLVTFLLDLLKLRTDERKRELLSDRDFISKMPGSVEFFFYSALFNSLKYPSLEKLFHEKAVESALSVINGLKESLENDSNLKSLFNQIYGDSLKEMRKNYEFQTIKFAPSIMEEINNSTLPPKIKKELKEYIEYLKRPNE